MEKPLLSEQITNYPGVYGEDETVYANQDPRQILDDVEIRELLIDHIGHRCYPARTWKISAVEDCNVHVGTLETFIEERKTIKKSLPCPNSIVHRNKRKQPEIKIWKLDLRSEYPALFTPHKETQAPIPNCEMIASCPICEGLGTTVCSTCNAGKKPDNYEKNQTFRCANCSGRGYHYMRRSRGGSTWKTGCRKCKSKGENPCGTCKSLGLVNCKPCNGSGFLLTNHDVVATWKTLYNLQVNSTLSGTTSVPDIVFYRAKGIELCNTQAIQCTPVFFPDSDFLNKFSSEVIFKQTPVPPEALVIQERHIISLVPVNRVTMSHRGLQPGWATTVHNKKLPNITTIYHAF